MASGFCQSETFPQLPPKLLAAVSSMLDVQDQDQCNTCQLVIVEASSMLSDPVSTLLCTQQSNRVKSRESEAVVLHTLLAS